MGFLTRLLEPKAATFGPLDDFWYRDIAGATASGVRINPKTALAISTVYACVRIISSTLAMLPLVVYQRQSDGGKERAPNHPVFDLLHTQPNVRQSSFQFREMMMGHVLLRGNAYAQIVPGPRGPFDQLVPLNPDRVTPRLVEDGTIHYEYRRPDGRAEDFLQDEIFHLANLSDDGVVGLSTLTLARSSFGLAKAAEDYGSRFFSEDQTPAGLLKMQGKLSPEARIRLKEDWKQHRGGHSTAVLEEGLEFQAMGMTNEDSQFLETRMLQVEEIASVFGVPLSLLQHTEKSTSWGTGITQLTLGFVIFTMQPWFTRWEQEIQKDLILDPDRFFAEFIVEGLLKGDPETRSKFYQIMIRTGIYTRNEVRILENKNPLPGLDEPLDPAQTNQSGQLNRQQGNTQGLALELATDTAARMVRKERAAVAKAALKYAADSNGWALWVGKFYDEFRTELMAVCKISSEAALAHTNTQRGHLLEWGAVDLDWDEKQRAWELVELMMEKP